MYFVLGLGIPMQIIVLPLYSIMARMHLIDDLAGLIVLYVVVNLPFTVYLLMSFFASLPGELEEAAALDGVGPGMTFWRIMLPLARGGLMTALTLVAIACWNETFLALMFLQTNANFTLPLALVDFLTQQQFTGEDFGVMFAGVSIAVPSPRWGPWPSAPSANWPSRSRPLMRPGRCTTWTARPLRTAAVLRALHGTPSPIPTGMSSPPATRCPSRPGPPAAAC